MHWDTPDTMPEMPNTGSNRKGQPAGLLNQARQEAWNTPKANDAEKRGNVAVRANAPELVAQAGHWQTPKATEGMGKHSMTNGKRYEKLGGEAEQWMTPNVPNGGRSVSEEIVASKGTTPEGDKRTVGLESQTKFWATPKTITGGAESAERKKELGRMESGGGDLQAQIQSWNANFAATNSQSTLDDMDAPTAKGMDSTWPTPATRDYKGANSEEHATVTGGGRKHMDQLSNFVAYSPQAQAIPDGEPSLPQNPGAPQQSAKRLNPYFVSWLMGWPLHWVSTTVQPGFGPVETELWRSRLHYHLCCLLEGHPHD